MLDQIQGPVWAPTDATESKPAREMRWRERRVYLQKDERPGGADAWGKQCGPSGLWLPSAPHQASDAGGQEE